LPPVDILNEGTTPCHRFQIPYEDKTPVFSPCVGIVPCTGFCGPKPGFPLAETIADENALFPNASKKENDIEPTNMVLEEGP
jgi:hypothetical protein